MAFSVCRPSKEKGGVAKIGLSRKIDIRMGERFKKKKIKKKTETDIEKERDKES